MPFEVMRISAFMYNQHYINFLLEHYAELNMPYPFHTTLSYIASPVLLEEEKFLALDDDHEVIGALSFIRGTAEHDYSNREIVQVQVAYIQKQYQRSAVLLHLLQMMTQCLVYKEEPLSEVVFWTGEDKELQRTITKRFHIMPEQHNTVFGKLTYYSIPFSMLQQYTNQFRQPRYF